MADTTDRSDDARATTGVRVSKVYTRNGERLEVRSGEYRSRIDALELESLTWQDDDTLADLVATARQPEGDLSAIDGALPEQPTRIRNEYGTVDLDVTDGPDGDRLHVSAPKLGYAVDLSPEELHAIAQQSRATFSEFLSEPFGPGAEEHGTDFH